MRKAMSRMVRDTLFGAICGMTFGWLRPATATNRRHCTQPSEHLRLLQGGEVEALVGVNQRQTCVCRYDFLSQQPQCFGLYFFLTSKIPWRWRCFGSFDASQLNSACRFSCHTLR